MKFIDQYIEYIKLAVVVSIVTCAIWLTRDHYQGVIAKQKVEQDKKSAELIARKNAQIKKGNDQHEQDQALINFLHTESGSPSGVQYIKSNSCGNSKGNSDQDRTARLFSEKINRALEKLREGDRNLAFRCDQLNIDAIRNNTTNY